MAGDNRPGRWHPRHTRRAHSPPLVIDDGGARAAHRRCPRASPLGRASRSRRSARRARVSRPSAMRQDVVAPRVACCGGSPAPRWVAPRGARHRASASSDAPRSVEGARAFFRRCPPARPRPSAPTDGASGSAPRASTSTTSTTTSTAGRTRSRRPLLRTVRARVVPPPPPPPRRCSPRSPRASSPARRPRARGGWAPLPQQAPREGGSPLGGAEPRPPRRRPRRG